MIPVPSGARVWLPAGHTDMRNYAERAIMRSTRPSDLPTRLVINNLVGSARFLAPHNSGPASLP
jgi:hypothetical protein